MSKSKSNSKPGLDGLRRLKSLRPRIRADLLRPRRQPSVKHRETLTKEPGSADGEDDAAQPVLSRFLSRRATSWTIRVAALFPLLTSQPSDAPQLSIPRKPVSNSILSPSPPSPPSPPLPPPPPPPVEAPPPPPPPPTAPQTSTTPSSPTLDSPSTINGDASDDTANLEMERKSLQSDDAPMSCPQYNPPEPPCLSPDVLERPPSANTQLPTSDPVVPAPGPDYVKPEQHGHGLDTQEWTLQTSFLEGYVEGGPLVPAQTDSRPEGASLAAPATQTEQVALLIRHPERIIPTAPTQASIAPPVLNVNGAKAASSRTMAQPLPPPPPPPPSSNVPHHGSSRSKGRRRSWIPGSRSRANSFEVQGNQGHGHSSSNNSNGENVHAWVIAEDSRAEYNTSFLRNGEKVPELWNQDGAVLVYLFPKGSGHGPSFKVPEFTVSTSYVFNELIRSEMESLAGGRNRGRSFGGTLSVEDATRVTSPTSTSPDEYYEELALYIPTSPPTEAAPATASSGGEPQIDLNRLIAVRNLFAFLTGQPLVGTKTAANNFRALLGIADLLEEFGFSSPDEKTFGTAVDLSFGFYRDQLGLADCRHSREETLEALILGERMRSMDLYNEAFAHGAGKYAAMRELRLSIFELVSQLTRERLERAHLDLVNRQHNVNESLEQFEFPSLFAGIANSTSIPELKAVRFKIWKASFQKMRHFVLGHYRALFGSWPPKASNKKNPFVESGLNRLVLRALYSDMCALYDLLVDRNNLTSRVIDEAPAISAETDKMTTSALRNILSEFDRSKPPVLPPVPFDLPQIPSMASVLETYSTLTAKEQARFDKKMKEHELILVLNKAYNYDLNGIELPFLDRFKEFELREAKGKTSHDIADHRIGYWLFLYSVLQSLPMLVVDAPDLEFTEGVEYFLCEPPMGNPPWVDAARVRKMWYEVAGGGGYVELSADAVMFSPEAVYHRSHCWLAAKRWEEMKEESAASLTSSLASASASSSMDQPRAMSPLEPPHNVFQEMEVAGGSNPGSASGHSTPSPPPLPGTPRMAIRAASSSRNGSRDRSRAASRNQSPAKRRTSQYRSSIVMGLEPLDLEPPPSLHGNIHQRSSSLGERTANSRLGSRSVSVGNLAGLAPGHQDSRSSSPGSKLVSGVTFEDILGDSEKKSKKKRGRFF